MGTDRYSIETAGEVYQTAKQDLEIRRKRVDAALGEPSPLPPPQPAPATTGRQIAGWTAALVAVLVAAVAAVWVIVELYADESDGLDRGAGLLVWVILGVAVLLTIWFGVVLATRSIDYGRQSSAAPKEREAGTGLAYLWSLVTLFLVLVAIPVATTSMVVLLRERGGFRAEIVLPSLILIGAVAFIAVMMALIAVIRSLGLSDPNQALGLPRGSIRAIIAILIILLFATVAIFLYQGLRDGEVIRGLNEQEWNDFNKDDVIASRSVVIGFGIGVEGAPAPVDPLPGSTLVSTATGVTVNADNAVPVLLGLGYTVARVDLETGQAASLQAPGGETIDAADFVTEATAEVADLTSVADAVAVLRAVGVDVAEIRRYDVEIEPTESSRQFALQLLTTLSTLVVALSAFYFGHRSVSAAKEEAAKGAGDEGPGTPTLDIVDPDPRGGPHHVTPEGTLDVTVRQTKGESVLAEVISSTESTHGTVKQVSNSIWRFTRGEADKAATLLFKLVDYPDVNQILTVSTTPLPTIGVAAPKTVALGASVDVILTLPAGTTKVADPTVKESYFGVLERKTEGKDDGWVFTVKDVPANVGETATLTFKDAENEAIVGTISLKIGAKPPAELTFDPAPNPVTQQSRTTTFTVKNAAGAVEATPTSAGEEVTLGGTGPWTLTSTSTGSDGKPTGTLTKDGAQTGKWTFALGETTTPPPDVKITFTAAADNATGEVTITIT